MFTFLWMFGFLLHACQDTGKVPEKNAAVQPAMDTSAVPPMGAGYLLGKFNPGERSDFRKLSPPYADRSDLYLHKDAFEAFEKMWKAAAQDGVKLRVISATRSFAQQKTIWEGKWERFAKATPDPKARALKILEYSSMPGSSRHHWGTDIDLNDLNNPAFEKGGKYQKVYEWLEKHAHEYGFCQPYTAGRPHGYQEEKWHWSYTPLSKPFLEEYKKTISDNDIKGFKGAELAPELHTVEYYVGGINQECQ